MKAAHLRARLIAAILAVTGLWLVATTSADAHASLGAGAVLTDRNWDAGYADRCSAEPAACDSRLGLHGACCGSANSGCCVTCMLLIPREPATAVSRRMLPFASALAETAAGVAPGKLKKPPRFVR
jgi:hypothetical protein